MRSGDSPHRRVMPCRIRSGLEKPLRAPRTVLLIVEADLRDNLGVCLGENGWTVHAVATLASALRALRDHPIDAVIYDAALADFPLDLFLFGIERLARHLSHQLIVLHGPVLEEVRAEIIERTIGVKIWREVESSDILQAIQTMVSRQSPG